MTRASTKTFLLDLLDLAWTLVCDILTCVGVLAIVGGGVFFTNGAFHGASLMDLAPLGAVVFAGVASCAGAIFLSGPSTKDSGGER